MKDINALPFNLNTSESVGQGTLFPVGFSIDEIVQLYWKTAEVEVDIDFTVNVTYNTGPTTDGGAYGTLTDYADARDGASTQSECACPIMVRLDENFGPITIYENPPPVDPLGDTCRTRVDVFTNFNCVKSGDLYYPHLFIQISPYWNISSNAEVTAGVTAYLAGTVTAFGKPVNMYYVVQDDFDGSVSATIAGTVGIHSELTP